MNTLKYDPDLAKYIPGMLELMFQGVIDTKEQVAHVSYKDMETLEFRIILTNNYYTNSNSMHIYFPIRIKRIKNLANDIFAHFIKEISITHYRNDKQLMSTFSPYEIY